MRLGDRAFSEKRDFIRMRIDTPLKAQLRGDDIAMDGLCHELSGGGMRLETTHSLAPGTEVDVTISAEHGHNPTLRAKTRVTRVHAEQNHYVLGVLILEILS